MTMTKRGLMMMTMMMTMMTTMTMKSWFSFKFLFLNAFSKDTG